MNADKQPVHVSTIELDYEEEYTLLQLEEKFQEEVGAIKAEDATEIPTFFKVGCEIDWDGEDTSVDFQLVCYRWETDKEQADRIKAEALKEKKEAAQKARTEKEKEALLADPDFQAFQSLYTKFATLKSKHRL